MMVGLGGGGGSTNKHVGKPCSMQQLLILLLGLHFGA